MNTAELEEVLASIKRRQGETDAEGQRLWRIANEEHEDDEYDEEQDAPPGSVKAYEYAEDFALEQHDSLYLSDLICAVEEFLAANPKD